MVSGRGKDTPKKAAILQKKGVGVDVEATGGLEEGKDGGRSEDEAVKAKMRKGKAKVQNVAVLDGSVEKEDVEARITEAVPPKTGKTTKAWKGKTQSSITVSHQAPTDIFNTGREEKKSGKIKNKQTPPGTEETPAVSEPPVAFTEDGEDLRCEAEPYGSQTGPAAESS